MAIGQIGAAEPPVVKVVYGVAAEPVSWTDEAGTPQGIEVELSELCLSKLGLKAEAQFYPWSRAQKLVEDGAADVLITTPTKARFAWAVFGKEIAFPLEIRAFIKKGNTGLAQALTQATAFEQLKPYEIVDYIGDGWTDVYLPKSQGFKIGLAPKIDSTIQMVAIGRADLLLSFAASVNWKAQRLHLADQIEEVKLNLPHVRNHFVFMVSRRSIWADRGLAKALDGKLLEIRKSGEMSALLKKYGYTELDVNKFDSQLQTAEFYTAYDRYPTYVPGK